MVQALVVFGKHNSSRNCSGFSALNPGKPAAFIFFARNGWREGAESNTLLKGGEKGFFVGCSGEFSCRWLWLLLRAEPWPE